MIPTDLVVEKLRGDNLRAYLEQTAISRGDASQQERYAAGVLPDAELVGLARTELFDPFVIFPKRIKMKAEWIQHHRPHDILLETVAFATAPLATFDPETWKTIKRFDKVVEIATAHPWMTAAGATFTLEAREHTAQCTICKATRRQRSVLISTEWAGRPLSREYAL